MMMMMGQESTEDNYLWNRQRSLRNLLTSYASLRNSNRVKSWRDKAVKMCESAAMNEDEIESRHCATLTSRTKNTPPPSSVNNTLPATTSGAETTSAATTKHEKVIKVVTKDEDDEQEVEKATESPGTTGSKRQQEDVRRKG